MEKKEPGLRTGVLSSELHDPEAGRKGSCVVGWRCLPIEALSGRPASSEELCDWVEVCVSPGFREACVKCLVVMGAVLTGWS